MYDNLVKRLRNKGCQICPICREAADAIEELSLTAESYKRSMEAWADEAANAQPHWIPVTERLPGDSGYYIVCAKDGSRTHVSFVKYQYRYKSWVLSGARAYWRITHWMPLPEPPKFNFYLTQEQL